MRRGKRDRESGVAAAPDAAGRVRLRRFGPWLTWGGLALALLVVGFALGLLVSRWDSVSRVASPEPGAEAPANPAEAGPSPDVAARIGDLKARLTQHPGETSTQLALAHLSLDAGRFAEAITLYQEVLRQEPENPDALMHMGAILLRGGHGEEALRHLDRALRRDPDNAHALWDKAQVQATLLGDDAGALKTWERFLKVAPGPEDAARVRGMMAEARSRMQRRPAAAGNPAGGMPVPGPGSLAPEDPTVQAARELLARIGAGPSPGTPGRTSGAPDATGGVLPVAAHPGERLFWEKGCGGCHAIRGVGGQAAPDLAGRGRSGGRDMVWHVRFLKEPAALIPGTRMPSYRHLSEQELRSLAEFLASL